MKIDVTERIINLKEVSVPIVLENDDGEKLAITMRDFGFGLDYISKQKASSFVLKNGDIVPA